jgi:hypothetical protein
MDTQNGKDQRLYRVLRILAKHYTTLTPNNNTCNMWTTIILNIILSIIIIFIAHQLWEYCKINYTYPKTKNLVEIHASKYRQIAEDMERNLDNKLLANTNTPVVNITTTVADKLPPDFLPLEEKEWVHKELAAFIDTL